MIGNLEKQIQCFLLDNQIMIFKAVSDCLFVPLHSIIVDVYNALQALQCHKAYIVLLVHQKSTKDIDS